MGRSFRSYLWNRAVLLVFALPTLGFLGFLSQFVFGEPTGLEGLALFALPSFLLYLGLLWPFRQFAPVAEPLGIAGFFVFNYVFAVVIVWASRRGIWFIRDRRQPTESSHTETDRK